MKRLEKLFRDGGLGFIIDAELVRLYSNLLLLAVSKKHLKELHEYLPDHCQLPRLELQKLQVVWKSVWAQPDGSLPRRQATLSEDRASIFLEPTWLEVGAPLSGLVSWYSSVLAEGRSTGQYEHEAGSETTRAVILAGRRLIADVDSIWFQVNVAQVLVLGRARSLIVLTLGKRDLTLKRMLSIKKWIYFFPMAAFRHMSDNEQKSPVVSAYIETTSWFGNMIESETFIHHPHFVPSKEEKIFVENVEQHLRQTGIPVNQLHIVP